MGALHTWSVITSCTHKNTHSFCFAFQSVACLKGKRAFNGQVFSRGLSMAECPYHRLNSVVSSLLEHSTAANCHALCHILFKASSKEALKSYFFCFTIYIFHLSCNIFCTHDQSWTHTHTHTTIWWPWSELNTHTLTYTHTHTHTHTQVYGDHNWIFLFSLSMFLSALHAQLCKTT